MFELETGADMSRPDNREEALFQYDRCVSDADFAAWARKFGRHLAKRADDPEFEAEFEEANKAAEKAKDKVEKLLDHIGRALDQLEAVEQDDLTDAQLIVNAMNILEAASE